MPIHSYTYIEHDEVSSLIHDFNVGCNEATELEPLTGDALLTNLTVRFKRDIFYVSLCNFLGR